jgi:hypothetical protein
MFSRRVIKTLTGQHLNVRCGAGGTVRDLKGAVAAQAVRPLHGLVCATRAPPPPSLTSMVNATQGWAVDQQRLIFGGKQLDDSSALTQYGITDLSILYLVLRAQEGTPSGDEPEPEPEPLGSAALQVNVMSPAGTQCRITMRPDDTVGELKALVAQQDGMEASAVHRLFSPTGGPELQNMATLRQCGISDSSLLLLSQPECADGGSGRTSDTSSGDVAVTSVVAQAGGDGAEERKAGGGSASAVDAPRTRLKRRVSFSESLQERVADDESAMVPLEHAEGPLKENDGPSVDSALLDRLIVAFFEKGNIRSADGVREFVGQENLSTSGASVAERLEYIVETLRSGRRVGLLPSNARLGPEHSVRLARLLDYLKAAL